MILRIFLAGASGAIGRRLTPLLIACGHEVIGATRTETKMESLRQAGAEPILLDALDRDAVLKSVLSARPDVIVHQMTSLTRFRNLRNIDGELATTNRLRIEGTGNLIAAAAAAGVKRVVTQSFTGWPNERTGGRVKNEEDSLDPDPPRRMRRSLEAIQHLERVTLNTPGIAGVVLRYGGFYGPGTSVAADGDIVKAVRQRKFPVIGNGQGVWSWIHIDDAARATQFAIESDLFGVFNIVDDEPAEVSLWLPSLAQSVGAKPPHRIPGWVGRLLIGESGLSMMTSIRGSSNKKAKQLLGWRPAYASWREGFLDGLAAPAIKARSNAASGMARMSV
jgi:nucleoside-diphosphate-sugar epimerase